MLSKSYLHGSFSLLHSLFIMNKHSFSNFTFSIWVSQAYFSSVSGLCEFENGEWFNLYLVLQCTNFFRYCASVCSRVSMWVSVCGLIRSDVSIRRVSSGKHQISELNSKKLRAYFQKNWERWFQLQSYHITISENNCIELNDLSKVLKIKFFSDNWEPPLNNILKI